MNRILTAVFASIFLSVPSVVGAGGLPAPGPLLRALVSPVVISRPVAVPQPDRKIQEPVTFERDNSALTDLLDEATHQATLAIGYVSEMVRVQRLAATQT